MNELNFNINNSSALWEEIKATANFDHGEYDKELLSEIKQKLKLKNSDSIESNLNNVSVEDLLNAVLSALQPFSRMLADILALFKKANAKRGDKNLQIKLEFLPDEFDLNYFTEKVELCAKTVTKTVELYKPKNFWNILDIFKLSQRVRISDIKCNDELERWLYEYWNLDNLPNFFPAQFQTNFCNLDDKIKVVWDILKYFYNKILPYKDGDNNWHERVGYLLREDRGNDYLSTEHDRFLGMAIRNIVYKLDKFKNSSDNDKLQEEALISKEIDEFLKSCEPQKIEIQVTVKEILNVLTLPFWKKRYEMYSVWIFSQISDSLSDFGLEYNLIDDDKLSFSFGGNLLATCTACNPQLQIWAELRSPVKSTVNPAKRTGHIQPDYSIVFEPGKEPENAVAVIECKQYRKSNTKNFYEAVVDYVNGRIKAVVFLVNHGAIASSVSDKIQAEGISSTRYALYGNVQTDSTSCKDFKNALKKVMLKCLPVKKVSGQIEVRLTWGDVPRDLDLELYIGSTSDNKPKVYYNHKFTEYYAKLDNDVTTGQGPETITIFDPSLTSYDIIVNNYSGEKEFDKPACVTVTYGGKVEVIENMGFTHDDYWYVGRIEGSILKIINQIKRK